MGARARLDAAWIAAALNFLAHRLETGAATHMSVISIVTLGRAANVVIICEQPPHGHGPYFPSLEFAEDLLTRNSNASCALILTFSL
jgi:hypothetical protein